MPAPPSRPLSAASLAPVASAFDRWRSRHGQGRRIPDELWGRASRLASEHGVHPVSKALRLNYYSLKRRVESLRAARAQPASGLAGETGAVPAFVEIPMVPERVGLKPLELELESPTGWTLRVRSEALDSLDVAGMVRVLGGLPA